MNIVTVKQAIERMHRRYAGDAKYPPTGGAQWLLYLAILNDKKDDFAQDPVVRWESCFEERTFGTTATGTLIYSIDKDVFDLSDYVYIDTTDGRTVRFTVIKPKDRHSRRQCAYLNGRNPKKLNFTDIPSAAIGGTIRAGIYAVPKDMRSASDIVPIDNPEWAVLAGAAELAFNDPSKEDKYPDLVGQANDAYQAMIDAAESLPDNQPSQIPDNTDHDIAGCEGDD